MLCSFQFSAATVSSTHPERGEDTEIVVGQAFGEDGEVMIDFVDPNVEDILVRFRASMTPDEVWAGTLVAGDTSVWGTPCQTRNSAITTDSGSSR